MNKHLQNLSQIIQQDESLTKEQKQAALQSLKAADKELEITAFKLDRTEKVKRTTAILLEETIEELEQKRKAVEAQNKELEIESALEKVRSSSLAMYKSDELKQAVKVVFKELQGLNFAIDGAAFIVTPIENSKDFNVWIGDDHAEYPNCFRTPFYDTPPLTDIVKAMESGANFFSRTYSFEEKNSWFKYAFEHTDYKDLPPELKTWILEQQYLTQSMAWANKSGVGIHFHQQRTLTENEIDILKRFSKVFDQAYIRFLDLQKAEAQAREAQIEAALERVRSRTMAMQHSNELAEAANVLFQQVQVLKLPVLSCGYNIWQKGESVCTGWMSDLSGSIQQPFNIPLTESPTFIRFYQSKQMGEQFYSEDLQGEELADHYRYMLTLPGFIRIVEGFEKAGFALPSYQVNNVVNFLHGNLVFITYEPVPEAHDIFRRFGKVFEQTYTRFLDLQKAEAQAQEAIKRASVDRVRAEIASMRTTSDLERITPLVWNELTTVGVPFIRCGVFIMDEEQEKVHTFLSTPDGKAIATLHVPFDFNLPLIANGVEHWRQKKVYQEHWNAATFIESWTALSALAETSTTSPQNEHPPENLYLQLLPFLQGMLYVGGEVPLTEDELQLSQNLADAFSTAYARYEDFNKLEAAKKQVDSALNELQATQKQLVQSEKMASLGELTAGIAHEIQNPLNFVNNFSEVNKEMLDELKAERLKPKGERDEAVEEDLINDLIDNEEKINHHGKRADAIVKGMLQHSRSSTGVKEPTDINALADEYLRLSYHGLRAKDKSFNAEMKTDFDPTIGKINIIPQDIGRVLLNLYNNAFYAVNQQKSKNLNSYQPTVSVTTKKSGNSVLITVSDNGNGIPQKIVDKIFQPFFTTKPTGQGTGLGLSLSYDIIKAHGGEIKVETKDGEGSEFVIQIPKT